MTNEELEEKIGLADFRLDKMKDDIHILYEENKQLKERIDKAIDFLHNNTMIGHCKEHYELLEILGDKNE